jgi:hypothetical protein
VPAFYFIDKEHRVVMSSGSGVLTREDMVGHQNRLLKDPDFDPSFSQILDFTNFTRVDVKPEDVLFLAERKIFSPDSHRAVIAGNDLVYGLARMFEIIREGRGDTGVRVFRDREEALAWALAKEETR